MWLLASILLIAMLFASPAQAFRSNSPQGAGGGAGIIGGTCPAGQFMHGISATGAPICSAPPAGAGVTISATAPTPPVDGTLWFDTASVQTFIRYNDGTSSQWVPLNHVGGGGGGTVFIGATAPPSPQPGTLWFNNTTGQMGIYYNNQWVLVIDVNGGHFP
jgi:hypothetical protein